MASKTAFTLASLSPHGSDMAVNRHDILNDAWGLSKKLVAKDISLEAIDSALDGAAPEILDDKLSRHLAYVSSPNRGENEATLRRLFKATAEENGKKLAFSDFRARAEGQLAGIVITAHPTFSLSKEAWHEAGRLLQQKLANAQSASLTQSADAPSRASDTKNEQRAANLTLLPDASPSLTDELDYANAAIRNIRLSLRRVWEIYLDVAAALYPDEWQALVPSLATIASWVGFDLDGRTDIGWSQSLNFRYVMTLMGLEELTAFWQTITSEDEITALDETAAVKAALETLHTCFAAGLSDLKQADAAAHYASFNRQSVARRESKDAARKQVSAALDALMQADLPHPTKVKIATFRAEWNTIGLGLSHIHFRLNAVQLHNAIRPVINLQQAPDRSASRRHYLDAVATLLKEVKPETIHYGILSEEQTTAKRVFMLAAQFRKHFDDNSSLRMLVAESDTPFTLLVALYYAKLFGVDDYVEISPLFETAIGLQRGDRVIAELLDNPDFMAYIQNQGRFCVQLGFSDSGRYVGQIAASLAIERFKLRLIQLWEKRGLSHIKLVFFDTHGESIGRGAHPASTQARYTYTHTPEVRRALDAMENEYKHEVSYQGGDGYLWFLERDLAFAIVTDLITARLTPPVDEVDALYTDSDWSLDFFLTLTEVQQNLTREDGYIRLIDSIGQAMMYPTGSRAVKRQGRGHASNRLESVSQIRAIPNNAILQQLGFMANTIMGLGMAASRSPLKFTEIAKKSARLQQLGAMAFAALNVSNVDILAAYLTSLSPFYWLDRCEEEKPSKQRSKMLRLSRSLEDIFDGSSMRAVLRKMRRDSLLLEDMLVAADIADGRIPAVKPRIVALHTLRIALITYIYMKSMDVPRFSTRQDVSLHDLIEQILHLDIDESVAELRHIFPAHIHELEDEPYGETASYDDKNSGGYLREHREIFDELELAYRLILKISSLIACEIGAVG